MAEVIVSALNLEHIQADSVDPAMPLFGQSSPGWGLDSIDALEIVLELQRSFGVEISDEQVGKRVLHSVRTIVEFIEVSRQPTG